MMGSNLMPVGAIARAGAFPTNPWPDFASHNLGACGWDDVSHDTRENQRDTKNIRSKEPGGLRYVRWRRFGARRSRPFVALYLFLKSLGGCSV
jgi:hypothetical protein